jgi:hypothetical protein
VTEPFDPVAYAREVMSSLTNGDEPDHEPPHTWTPIDLVTRALQPPEPPTIAGLVYPGRRHLFSGEPEALKSWAAMVLCINQIHAGHTTMYIDFEMGERETLARLRDLDITDQQLTDHFLYLQPDEPFHDPLIQQDMSDLLTKREPTLVVVDAFTGALQTHQLDPNKSIDIETFYRRVVDPLRSHGAAVVILDHLPKDPTTRGKFAIGSERKVGGCEVHLGFEVISPFGRGRTGKAKIVTHKDRPGYLHRPRAATLELNSSLLGDITWKIELAEQTDTPPAYFRPTHLMEKVSRYLEERGEQASMNQIESNIPGNATYVRRAAEFLVEDGYATEQPGARGARLFISLRQYREPTSSTSSDLVPTSSGRSGEMTSSTSSPPYRGTSVIGDEVEDKNQPRPRPNTNDDRIPFSSTHPDPDTEYWDVRPDHEEP